MKPAARADKLSVTMASRHRRALAALGAALLLVTACAPEALSDSAGGGAAVQTEAGDAESSFPSTVTTSPQTSDHDPAPEDSEGMTGGPGDAASETGSDSATADGPADAGTSSQAPGALPDGAASVPSAAGDPSGQSGEIIDTARVLALLETIPVKGRAPKTGYSRDLFGSAWTDDVSVDGGHNGCDTRNDILRRDLTDFAIRTNSSGCTVLVGVLHDVYTGTSIDFTRGQTTSAAVQIDHVVALSDAWQKGAQQLSDAQRWNFANDPVNLQAVDGPTNGQKGAGDAATWLPPNKSYRCVYVARQTMVKATYSLWMTQAEHDAIARILAQCPASMTARLAVPDLGKDADGSVAPTISTTPAVAVTSSQPASPSTSAAGQGTTPASPGTSVAGQECYPLSNGGNCYQPGQMCAKRYYGDSGVSGDGRSIECLQEGDYWRWRVTG